MFSLHISPSSVFFFFFACTGMMWMWLFSASFEEMYSHSHNPNCYTSHPSGKTDSHIAGCRITLSQQDRNEHGQWQNICENTEYLCLTAFKFGSHSQHWPRFTDSSTGILFFRAAHSGCKFPVVLNVLLLGWDFRGHGGLVFEAQKEAKLSLIFLQHRDLNLTNIRSIKGQVRFILLSQIHTLAIHVRSGDPLCSCFDHGFNGPAWSSTELWKAALQCFCGHDWSTELFAYFICIFVNDLSASTCHFSSDLLSLLLLLLLFIFVVVWVQILERWNRYTWPRCGKSVNLVVQRVTIVKC